MKSDLLVTLITCFIFMCICVLHAKCDTKAIVYKNADYPAFISSLPFTVAAVHKVDVLPTEYYPDRGFNFPYQLQDHSCGLISPRGRLFIWFRQSTIPGLQRFDVVDLMDKNKVYSVPFLKKRVSDIMQVFWDPLDESYMYVNLLEHDRDIATQQVIWRIRWAGDEKKQISRNDENAQLVAISSDGKQLLANVSAYPHPEGQIYPSKTVWQSLEDLSRRNEVKWDDYIAYPAPNMIFAAGHAKESGNEMVYFNSANKLTCKMFSVQQAILLSPVGYDPVSYGFTSPPMWLPNSSGVLVTVNTPDSNAVSGNTLFYIKTNGEVTRITKNVYIISSSQNGQYWLFSEGKQWYLITAKIIKKMKSSIF